MAFAVIFIAISNLIKQYTSKYLKVFYLVLGISFSYYLHGNKIIFLLLAMSFPFLICKYIKIFHRFTFTIIIWSFCFLIKILSEIYHGFSFKFFGIHLNERETIGWQVSFGLIMLKIISFCMEYKEEFYSLSAQTNDLIIEKTKKHCDLCSKCEFCVKGLTSANTELSQFTFYNYIIYILYPPLYLSGPIILFNSFVFQINNHSISAHSNFIQKSKIIYIVRFLFLFFVMELFNHYIYVNCYMTNDFNKQIMEHFDYLFLALFSFMNLTFLWLKFSVIWKTARLWAWFDSIYTEENMNRCVFNNYCFEEFWRAWHRSFNIWIIRYVYIPLGGKNNKKLNMLLVFSFVALWHDLKLNLLIWGWFICILFVPEISVKSYFSNPKYDHLHNKWWFRLSKYFFCSFYIVLMIIANLIGFGMGSEGVRDITMKIIKLTSPIYFMKIVLFFIPLTVVIFYIRDRERLQFGIKLKF